MWRVFSIWKIVGVAVSATGVIRPRQRINLFPKSNYDPWTICFRLGFWVARHEKLSKGIKSRNERRAQQMLFFLFFSCWKREHKWLPRWVMGRELAGMKKPTTRGAVCLPANAIRTLLRGNEILERACRAVSRRVASLTRLWSITSSVRERRVSLAIGRHTRLLYFLFPTPATIRWRYYVWIFSLSLFFVK